MRKDNTTQNGLAILKWECSRCQFPKLCTDFPAACTARWTSRGICHTSILDEVESCQETVLETRLDSHLSEPHPYLAHEQVGDVSQDEQGQGSNVSPRKIT